MDDLERVSKLNMLFCLDDQKMLLENTRTLLTHYIDSNVLDDKSWLNLLNRMIEETDMMISNLK